MPRSHSSRTRHRALGRHGLPLTLFDSGRTVGPEPAITGPGASRMRRQLPRTGLLRLAQRSDPGSAAASRSRRGLGATPGDDEQTTARGRSRDRLQLARSEPPRSLSTSASASRIRARAAPSTVSPGIPMRPSASSARRQRRGPPSSSNDPHGAGAAREHRRCRATLVRRPPPALLGTRASEAGSRSRRVSGV